jgi:hypothetical protein
MDLIGRQVAGARRVEAVDPEELPAARIEKSQEDVPSLLVGYGVDVITGLDRDP